MPRINVCVRNTTLCGLLLAGLCSVAMALPSHASALAVWFNCGSIPPNHWCMYSENHSWAQVAAYWDGQSAVPMCAKIINSADQDNGTRACYTAVYVWSTYQPCCIGPNTWALAANGNSGVWRTISGYATT